MSPDREDHVLCRLRSAEGNLRAVSRMVEREEPFNQIYHQLNAVRAALQAIKIILIKEQLETSFETIRNGNASPELTQAIENLLLLFPLIQKE